MNCKQGDLAVFIRSVAGNEGAIVQCLRLATLSELAARNFIDNEPVWVIDPPKPTWSGKVLPFAVDSALRPIRDQPGADETLRWAEVPKEHA